MYLKILQRNVRDQTSYFPRLVVAVLNEVDVQHTVQKVYKGLREFSASVVKPEEPGPEDCCQSGCNQCVWDIFREDLKAYNKERAIMEGKPIPLDPFEEFERKLREEQQKRQAQSA